MLRRIIILILVLLPLSAHAKQPAEATAPRTTAPRTATRFPTSDFSQQYQGWNLFNSTCSAKSSIAGKEPQTAGTYPVYIHLVGAGGDYKGADATMLISEMAARGFVAGSISYNSIAGSTIAKLDQKTNCIYNGTQPATAVAMLCARPKADCSKGIVTSGHSEGSLLAVLAHNHESRINAVYALGFNDRITPPDFFTLTTTTPGNRTLPSDRLRIVDGTVPTFTLQAQGQLRSQLNSLTNLTCDTAANSCFRANGSGWYKVQDSEVQDGLADHCYFLIGGCGMPAFDPGWIPPSTTPWSLNANLDWLATFTTPLAAAQTGVTPASAVSH